MQPINLFYGIAKISQDNDIITIQGTVTEIGITDDGRHS